MNEVPVTNNGTSNLHIGGKVITPGATRMIDESLVPDSLKPEPVAPSEAAPPTDALAELADGNVKEITAALPGLSADDLARLEAIEQDKKDPRKGVLEGIAHERLRRASATESQAVAAVLDHTIEQIVELLPAMSAEELDAVEAAEHAGKQRQGIAEAIAHERKRRAAE